MSTALLFARKYLLGRKSLNAVNVVAIISSIAVAAVATALIVTLSVVNGYEDLIALQTAPIDPDLLIKEKDGKTFDASDSAITRAIHSPQIVSSSTFLIRPALLRVADKQSVAMVMGVDNKYQSTTGIDRTIFSGKYALQDPSSDSIAAYNIGMALASRLGVGSGFVTPIDIYIPRRVGVINPLMLATAFRSDYGFVSSVFATNQQDYDNRLIISLLQLRSLLSYDYPATDGIAVRIQANADPKEVQKALQAQLKSKYLVLDKHQQHPEIARLVAMEKWMTFMILLFILLLALFNVVSSLSMLLIEKQQDIRILRSIGADDKLISRIFVLSGTLITTIGASIGIGIGLLLCYLQQKYGFISMQSGFIVDSYPIRIVRSDVLIVLVSVILLGYLAAIYPVRFFLHKTK